MQCARREIDLGKIAYYSKRKIHPVTVEVSLSLGNKPCFSVCGNIWNSKKTDILCGGQCLDTIAEYIDTPLFNEIYRLWKAYHLNDMHSGTEEQEAELDRWHSGSDRYSYEDDVKHLKDVNLYEVQYDGKPYKYGSGWLYRPIPEDDLSIIKKIIMDGNI